MSFTRPYYAINSSPSESTPPSAPERPLRVRDLLGNLSLDEVESLLGSESFLTGDIQTLTDLQHSLRFLKVKTSDIEQVKRIVKILKRIQEFKKKMHLGNTVPNLARDIGSFTGKVATPLQTAQPDTLKVVEADFDKIIKKAEIDSDLHKQAMKLEKDYYLVYLVARRELVTKLETVSADPNSANETAKLKKQIKDLDNSFEYSIFALNTKIRRHKVNQPVVISVVSPPETLPEPTPKSVRNGFKWAIAAAAGLIAATSLATALNTNAGDTKAPDTDSDIAESVANNSASATTINIVQNQASVPATTTNDEPEQSAQDPDPPQGIVIQATPGTQPQVPRVIVEAGSNITDSQIAFRLPTGSFDASTITNPEIANSEASAIGSMARRGFSNDALHSLRRDIQGPTQFVVTTIDDRHIVRSLRTGRPTGMRLQKGEVFTATPLKDANRNQVYVHLAGLGYFPVGQLDNGDVVILSPYTQTVTQNASNNDINQAADQPEEETASNLYTPDTDQSLDDFMQDLFAEELASEAPTTKASNPEVEDILATAQIQMPNLEQVIPDYSVIPKLPQSTLVEIDNNQELELNEDDLEEIFTVDVIENAVDLLDPSELEMEPVKEQNEQFSTENFEAQVIPAKPMQQPEQTKGFFGRAKGFMKGLFN